MPTSEGPSPRRNKTRAARQQASEVLKYDHTQEQESGRSSARKRVPAVRAPVGGRSGRKAASAGSTPAPAISLGPSGLPLLRTSERGTFKRCRWLWKLEFIDLRKPNQTTPALMFGSMVHEALAGWYKKGKKRGIAPVDGFDRACLAEAERVEKLTGMPRLDLWQEWNERLTLGRAMLTQYQELYGNDDQWEVLATELPFQVIVTHPRDGVTPWFWYTGILDLLVLDRSTGKKLIVDHKTTAAIATKYLAIDEQTSAYWHWGVKALRNKRLIGPREQIDGLMFNFLRKQAPPDKDFIIQDGKRWYTNKDGSVSKAQPAPFFARHPVWRHAVQKGRTEERALAEMLDMQAVRREPERGAYKNPGKFTCPGCWAFDVCELHEVGADYEAMISQTTHTWDPYEAHEIYFAEAK